MNQGKAREKEPEKAAKKAIERALSHKYAKARGFGVPADNKAAQLRVKDQMARSSSRWDQQRSGTTSRRHC